MGMLVSHLHGHQSHAQPYHQHHNLIFQFIFSELMLANNEIQQISRILLSQHSEDDICKKLIPHLNKLVGPAHGYMRLFSWPDVGILSKLRQYCEFLCQDQETQGHEFNIHNAACKAWFAAFKCIDHFKACQGHLDLAPIQAAVNKLKKSIDLLARSISKAIVALHDDENLVFFLIRHHQEIDHIYAPRFVINLLFKMYSTKSLKVIQEFLNDRYTVRGFEHLLPLINAKISELKGTSKYADKQGTIRRAGCSDSGLSPAKLSL